MNEKRNCLECDKEMTSEQIVGYKYACSEECKDEWDYTCEDIARIEKKLCK